MKSFSLFLVALLSIFKTINGIVLVCDFKYQRNFDYTCDVKYLRITQKNDRTITEVFGDHLRLKSSDEVTHFNSKSNIIKFFPLNLPTFFKNLASIQIENATLREIEHTDLRQLGGTLKNLWLSETNIEALESGLFNYNPNISKLRFESNKIKHVDDGVISHLENLEELEFLENTCYYGSAHNRYEVQMTINEIELKCKDATYMAKRYQMQLEDLKDKMGRIEVECKCCKCEESEVRNDGISNSPVVSSTIKPKIKSKVFYDTNGSPV